MAEAVMAWKSGGCHCGQVRFEVLAPEEIEVYDCNCSICSLTAYLHLIVPRQRFRLLEGHEALTTYRFNTKAARHVFCSVCGIKSFYIPRSHADRYSVNARCLAEGAVHIAAIKHFDGKHWEEHIGEIGSEGRI